MAFYCTMIATMAAVLVSPCSIICICVFVYSWSSWFSCVYFHRSLHLIWAANFVACHSLEWLLLLSFVWCVSIFLNTRLFVLCERVCVCVYFCPCLPSKDIWFRRSLCFCHFKLHWISTLLNSHFPFCSHQLPACINKCLLTLIFGSLFVLFHSFTLFFALFHSCIYSC